MKKREKGYLGESIASLYLSLKGYKILKRNYTLKGGEIDIIASKNDEIVIIEVKTRKNDNFGAPKEAVDKNKAKHIIYGAKVFLNKNFLFDKKVRFDIIEVYLPKLKINHIKHAFEIF
ncbi:MAG: YraN family protein [Ruminococcaceae bacterium]|nr:YraN family protein [Oscillospiraceae bacterium]